MFFSQSLLSKKGPLGAIRVAAYFFKRLKKLQVQETDISSSVDNILQDELQAVTYRVLGYLLLGIVRIYARKVEYLLDDCQEVLIGINDFVVHRNKYMPADVLCAPCFTITVPESFELDAFDLEILDDTIEGNVLPQEKITLKDIASVNAGIRHYALDMYHSEEIASSHNSSSAKYTPLEDVLSSFRMDMHLRKSHNINSFTASMEKLEEIRFSREECMDLELFYAAGEEPQSVVKLYVEDCREKMKEPETSLSKDVVHGEESTEELQDLGEIGVNAVIKWFEGDYGLNIASSSKDAMHGEASAELPQDFVENGLNLVRLCGIEGDYGGNFASSSKDAMHGEASTEKLQDSCENGVVLVRSGGVEGEPADNVKPHGEDIQIDGEQVMVLETGQPESETICQVTRQEHSPSNSKAEIEKLRDSTYSQVELTDLDMLSGSKEPQELIEPFAEENHDDGEQALPDLPENVESHIVEDKSTARKHRRTPSIKVPEASGASTPQFMLIPTPSAKERARTTRKRKCVIDDTMVLPNAVLKKCIDDASDLVSKRRKVAHTALSVWKAKASRILHHGFFEPLVSCVSSELRSLFSEKKLKIMVSGKSVRPPKELDIPKAPTVGVSDLEKIGIAPETPVQRATLTKSFESPRSPGTPNYDRVTHEPLKKSFESPLSPGTPNNEERPELLEGVWKEPSPLGDQELHLNLFDEVTNSCLEDNNEMYGLSERTRIVARYLHRSFLNQQKRGEEGEVNLSQVVKGRTKKESARFFYEILVLNTKGYVDVKQDDAYGDILVRKLQTGTKLLELMIVNSD